MKGTSRQVPPTKGQGQRCQDVLAPCSIVTIVYHIPTRFAAEFHHPHGLFVAAETFDKWSTEMVILRRSDGAYTMRSGDVHIKIGRVSVVGMLRQ